MLTPTMIQENKEQFIELLQSIQRPNVRIDELIKKLENSDFFIAPASTQYHGAYEGGLCDHSLNVYFNMMHLVKYKSPNMGLDFEDENVQDSIKILALLHDISKMNLYERTSKNVKVYSADGDRSDALGNFYWDTTVSYRTREDKFVYGSHEATSEYIIRHYVPLTVEESSAIIHHMGGMSWDSSKDNIGEIFNRYPLALLLYMADMMSSYVDENDRYMFITPDDTGSDGEATVEQDS